MLASGEVNFKIKDNNATAVVYILYDAINSVVKEYITVGGNSTWKLSQDYDGELEILALSSNGLIYKTELTAHQIPSIIEFDELANLDEIENYLK